MEYEALVYIEKYTRWLLWIAPSLTALTIGYLALAMVINPDSDNDYSSKIKNALKVGAIITGASGFITFVSGFFGF